MRVVSNNHKAPVTATNGEISPDDFFRPHTHRPGSPTSLFTAFFSAAATSASPLCDMTRFATSFCKCTQPRAISVLLNGFSTFTFTASSCSTSADAGPVASNCHLAPGYDFFNSCTRGITQCVPGRYSARLTCGLPFISTAPAIDAVRKSGEQSMKKCGLPSGTTSVTNANHASGSIG